MAKFTTTEINAFFADIAAADKAQQAHSKAIWAWSKSDRSESMPVMADGANVATIGNLSCTMSPAPQSARTNASRKNWKINGKRATEAQVMAELQA